MAITAALPATLLIAISVLWGALALKYRAPGGRAGQVLSVTLWGALNVGAGVALCQGHFALASLGFALLFGGLVPWWLSLTPSSDRAWVEELSRLTSGTVEGNRVTLHNVRNFTWRSTTDYTPSWETRRYDLEHLDSVDMIISYWRGRAIAHMLISFGFDDGDHVAFSVEIRRAKNQSYSEIGGFFKEFELIVLAADERDVVHLRTNVRLEDAYLYRVRMPVSVMRALFLAYISEANALVRSPRFYHTIATNCTTLVYQMMKRIVGPLPFSYRVLFSGYMPEYAYSIGALDRRHPLEELRALGNISERAKQADRSDAFSADIRRGVPPLAAAATWNAQTGS
jgi:Domain of unknown function (DUF4105)